MNKAQQAIHEKMTYMMERVSQGPLSSFEEGQLLEILQNIQRGNSLWAVAVINHFKQPADQRDDWELINGLASQCRDDLFTMICVLGQAAVIYLLRTLND